MTNWACKIRRTFGQALPKGFVMFFPPRFFCSFFRKYYTHYGYNNPDVKTQSLFFLENLHPLPASQEQLCRKVIFNRPTGALLGKVGVSPYNQQKRPRALVTYDIFRTFVFKK
jgi:hypothetical protein